MRFPVRPALVCLGSLVAFVSLGLLACGGGGGGGTGTLRVSLTDSPACGFDAVKVTVEKVRVHQNANAGDGDAGWSEVVLAPPRTIDLLDLTNGIREELGQVQLPAGTYTQMRLVLSPTGHSVLPTGASQEVPLATPSGSQSGLKMNVDADVPANKVADFVIDFDACRSVVTRGNSGQYNLKPVLSGMVVLSDAGLAIDGYVDPSIALGSTRVSAQQAGVEKKATVPDASGRFVLAPLAAGSYELVVTANGHATAVLTGVTVTETEHSITSTSTARIAPPASAASAVAGTVSPPDADVRALQLLSGGPTVQVAHGLPDALTGAYAFTLPTAAPVKAGYAAQPSSLALTADAPVAGKYKLEATDGSTTKSAAIDFAGAVGAQNFSFP